MEMTKPACRRDNACRVFKCLHPLVRDAKVRAERQRTVVGHQKYVVTGPKWLEPVSQLCRPGCSIGDERNWAEQHANFSQGPLWKGLSGKRKTGGSGRVRVHDRPDVRPSGVGSQVHRNLG